MSQGYQHLKDFVDRKLRESPTPFPSRTSQQRQTNTLDGRSPRPEPNGRTLVPVQSIPYRDRTSDRVQASRPYPGGSGDARQNIATATSPFATSQPSTPWIWDPNRRQYVTYLSKRGYWINDNDERVEPPSSAAAQLRDGNSASAPIRSSMSAAKQRQGTQSFGTAARQTRLDSHTASSTSFSPAQNAMQASSPDNRQSTSGVDSGTQWIVGAAEMYKDPVTSQTRSVSLKNIRYRNESGQDINSQKDDRSKKDGAVPSAQGKASGQIIEARMPPQSVLTGASAVSPMVSDPGGDGLGGVRIRRFAIVEERPSGRECFRAIAIKTYMGEGVASQIKFHHSQIYAGRRVPNLLPTEMPTRRGGQMERPMQPQAIRVEPYDRARTLDPLSRLDYCDRVDFDYGNPEVTLFGRVHESSQAALHTQYLIVMADLVAVIRPSRAPTAPQERRQTTPRPDQAAVSGAPSTSAGLSARSTAPAPLRRDSTPGQSATAPASGQDKNAKMVATLRNLRAYAQRESLTWPVELATQDRLDRMFQDSQFFDFTIKEIARRLKEERDAASEDDEEDSDEDRRDMESSYGGVASRAQSSATSSADDVRAVLADLQAYAQRRNLRWPPRGTAGADLQRLAGNRSHADVERGLASLCQALIVEKDGLEEDDSDSE